RRGRLDGVPRLARGCAGRRRKHHRDHRRDRPRGPDREPARCGSRELPPRPPALFPRKRHAGDRALRAQRLRGAPGGSEMTGAVAWRAWHPVRVLPFLLPVSAALAQTDSSALQWLQRIYAASEKLSYSGTFVYQQGQRVETSRIVHVVDASGPRERLETLDGVPREIVRTGDEVVCYLPATQTIKIDKQPGRRPFPAILSEQLKDVSENYVVKKGEIERVGGYSCQVLTLEPKDRMRYG